MFMQVFFQLKCLTHKSVKSMVSKAGGFSVLDKFLNTKIETLPFKRGSVNTNPGEALIPTIFCHDIFDPQKLKLLSNDNIKKFCHFRPRNPLMSTTESSTKKFTQAVDKNQPESKTTTIRSNLLDFLSTFPDTTTKKATEPANPLQEPPKSGPIGLEGMMDMLRNISSDIEIRQETDFNVSFYNSTSKTSFR